MKRGIFGVILLVMFVMPMDVGAVGIEDKPMTICKMIEDLMMRMEKLETNVTQKLDQMDNRLFSVEKDVRSIKETVGEFESKEEPKNEEDFIKEDAYMLGLRFNTRPVQEQINALKAGINVEEIDEDKVMVVEIISKNNLVCFDNGKYEYEPGQKYVVGISRGEHWIEAGCAKKLN